MVSKKSKVSKIEIDGAEIIADSVSQQVCGTINGKMFTIVRSKGFQKDIGECDNEFIFEEIGGLTEKEKDDVQGYVEDKVKW